MSSTSTSLSPIRGSRLGLVALFVASTCVLSVVPVSSSFLMPPPSTSSALAFAGRGYHRQQRNTGNGEAHVSASISDNSDGKDDVLDCFDPLLSPHEYPAGIDAGAAAAAAAAAAAKASAESAAAEASAIKPTSNNVKEDDDNFDPFLTSPHDFPSVQTQTQTQKQNRKEGRSFGLDVVPPEEDIDDDDWSPLRGAMNVEKFEDAGDSIVSSGKARLSSNWAMPSATSSAPADAYNYQQQRVKGTASSRSDNDEGSSSGSGNPNADLFDVFDPRLSPHVYSGGIPECSEEEQASSSHDALSAVQSLSNSSKVGVLLIDHGSRRASSNDRLLELASVYEERSPDHFFVRAAHMEIAAPTIEDGIRDLIEIDGVSRIVCHPYFLSPGRHVQEDIPQLISEAIEALDIRHVPIVTTDPVGSSLDVMVNAIGSLVDESVRAMDGVDPAKKGEPRPIVDDEYKLGGFFGEVQRMIDEQLD